MPKISKKATLFLLFRTSWLVLKLKKKGGDINDKNGNYRIDDIPPGMYLIKACADGFRPDRQKITIMADDMVRADFTLHSEAKTVSLYGYVFEADNESDGLKQPISGAEVELRFPTGQVFISLTDEEGSCRIDDIPTPQPLIGPSITAAASKIGYEPRSLDLPAITSGEEKEINFYLKPMNR